jgi:hypothetical protein
VNFPESESIRKRTRRLADDELNVIVLAIDSTARNQFIRHMPRTLDFMRENGFDIFGGYNKVNN